MWTHATCRRWVTVGAVVSVMIACAVGLRSSSHGADPPGPAVPTSDDVVARIESLGGHVGIDGEAPDQPVWMVDLTDIPVPDDLLAQLRAFPKLEVLQLHGTGLRDAQLAEVGRLTSLRELSLSDTKISDEGLKQLQGLTRLQHLSLHGTRVSDEGLQQLVGMSELADLLHADTAMTDAGVAAFQVARRARVESPRPDGATSSGLAEPLRVEARLAESLHRLGRELFPTTRNDPARRRQSVSLLEAALRADPDNERIQLDLADAYLLLDNELSLVYAIELYEQVLRRRPSQTGLFGRLAEAYRRLGNVDAAFALAAARGAAERESPFPAALQLADLAAETGDLSRGLSELDTLAKLTKQHPGVELLRAALLREAGQAPSARTAAEAILKRVGGESPYAAVARQLVEGK